MFYVKVTLFGVYAISKKSLWAVQHLPVIWHTWSYCWWLVMVWISSWDLVPFLLNQLCHFQAFYHVASTSEQHTRVTDSWEHQSHSCHFVDLLLLLRTTCGSNFILGSWSYLIKPAVPFSSILLYREYFGATRAVTEQPRTLVTHSNFAGLLLLQLLATMLSFLTGSWSFLLRQLCHFRAFLPCREWPGEQAQETHW